MLVRLALVAIAMLVVLSPDAGAQAPCRELARLRGEADEARKQALQAPAYERCPAYVRWSWAVEAILKYADNNRDSCEISPQSLDQMEMSRRMAVKSRKDVCAGLPSRPFPPEIIRR